MDQGTFGTAVQFGGGNMAAPSYLLILRLFLHADQRLECVLPVIIPCKLTSSPARLNAAQSILQQVLWRRALA